MNSEPTPPPEVTLPTWTVAIETGNLNEVLALHVQTFSNREALRLARDWLDTNGVHWDWQRCPTAVYLTENPPRGRIYQ